MKLKILLDQVFSSCPFCMHIIIKRITRDASTSSEYFISRKRERVYLELAAIFSLEDQALTNLATLKVLIGLIMAEHT